jgi:S1-C subfamily serine protease
MQKAVPEPAEAGVRVRRPRLGSEAERAALVDGDRVAAIDNQEIRSDLDLGSVQGAIRAHASGDTLELLVIRSDGETVQLTARRP